MVSIKEKFINLLWVLKGCCTSIKSPITSRGETDQDFQYPAATAGFFHRILPVNPAIPRFSISKKFQDSSEKI